MALSGVKDVTQSCELLEVHGLASDHSHSYTLTGLYRNIMRVPISPRCHRDDLDVKWSSGVPWSCRRVVRSELWSYDCLKGEFLVLGFDHAESWMV